MELNPQVYILLATYNRAYLIEEFRASKQRRGRKRISVYSV